MANELSNSEKLVRILSGILAVVFIIVLILVKVANPEFKLGVLIFVIVIIILFFVGITIGFHFWQKRKKMDLVPGQQKIDSKLPPAITLEQARELAKKAVVNPHYCDYIPHCLGETNELLGKMVKSFVYTYKGIGVYKKDTYVIVMNRHYPNETMSILINPEPHEINRAKTLAASHPEDEPTKEQTVAENLLTGTTITTTKEIHEKKEDEENKKKGEL